MDHLWNTITLKSALHDCAFNGTCFGNRICIDSRDVKKFDIFAALKGTKTNGHKYIVKAFENGASCALVEYVPDNIRGNFIVVPDVMAAIRDLAKFNRTRSKAIIIGVTGSVGKTSTKEALSLICKANGTTFCSEGNFNNDLGLPISLASMPLGTKYGVFELGMNHAGEIAYLTQIAHPHIAVITSIEHVHAEFFKSLKEIAIAKGEIFLGMDENGVAVINGDTQYHDLLAQLAQSVGVKKVFSFGTKQTNDSILVDYKPGINEHLVKAKICGNDLAYKIKANGYHQALNTLAVLTVAKILGFDLKLSSIVLENFISTKGRGEIADIEIKGQKVRIIDDSYNASPASIRASLLVLKHLNDDIIKRKIAVLGDMYELGIGAVDEHVALLDAIENSGIHYLITVGSLMQNLFNIAPNAMRLAHFETYEKAKDGILNFIQEGDCWLFKGSHGTKVYEVVRYLREYK